MIVSDIESWVANRIEMGDQRFREAAHIILYAVSRNAAIKDDFNFVFKGGAFLSIAMDHDRSTSDIDFSSPIMHDEEIEKRVIQELTLSLEDAELDLDYSTTTKVQSAKVKPNIGQGKTRTYPTLHVKVGYSDKRDEKLLARLNRNQSSHTITIDFSFNEPFYDIKEIELVDPASGSIYLNCYSFDEVVAEKFRAILQQPVRKRERQQDLYDIYRINQKNSIDPYSVHNFLIQKAEGRGIEQYLNINGLIHEDVVSILKEGYNGLSAQVENLPPFDQTFGEVNALFQKMPWG